MLIVQIKHTSPFSKCEFGANIYDRVITIHSSLHLQHFVNISQNFLPTEGFSLRLSPPVWDSSLTFPFSLKLRSVIWLGSGGSLRTLTCLVGEDIFSPRLNICRKIKIENPTWNERQSHARYCLRRRSSSSVGSEVMRARACSSQYLWRLHRGDCVK